MYELSNEKYFFAYVVHTYECKTTLNRYMSDIFEHSMLNEYLVSFLDRRLYWKRIIRSFYMIKFPIVSDLLVDGKTDSNNTNKDNNGSK